jgi:hypothetical protein
MFFLALLGSKTKSLLSFNASAGRIYDCFTAFIRTPSLTRSPRDDGDGGDDGSAKSCS